MDERTIKRFKIMISSPSDVTKYADSVRTWINEFNTSKEALEKGIVFIPIDWRNNTRPAYGKTAQSIINEQLTDTADAVIALFGAKFGTPTEKYQSGSLEEIERVHANGGEVFIYFGSGKLVNISSIDPEQLKALNEFKNRMKGLYREFSTKQVLRERVKNDLSSLATCLLTKEKKSIAIYSFKDGHTTDTLSYTQCDFMDHPIIHRLKDNIKKCIDVINTTDVVLHSSTGSNSPTELDRIANTVKQYADILAPRSEIRFSQDTERIIRNYCQKNQLHLIDDFMCVGDAHRRGNAIQGHEICGTTDERKRVQAIVDAANQIREFNEYEQFFSQFDGLYYLPLVTRNESDCFAEDISIKITVPIECYFDVKSIKLSGSKTCDELKSFINNFVVEETDNVEAMECGTKPYPIWFPTQMLDSIGMKLSEAPKTLEYCQEYLDTDLENYYPYRVYLTSTTATYKFELSYGLKQFTSQFLCAILMFKKAPQRIEYSIISKSINREINGTILDNGSQSI